MLKSPFNTAILVFTRSAREEHLAKTFSHSIGKRGNYKIARLLNRQVLKASHQSRIPTFIFTEKEQKGDSFGKKLANAFEDLFAKGFESVIAIGNDCLAVDGKMLNRVAADLKHTDLVAGPTNRGGIYLLGMSADAYCRKAFLNFNWQTNTLFNSLLADGHRRLASVLRLKEEKEINDPQDLLEVLFELSNQHPLKRSLLAILVASYQFVDQSILGLISKIKATFALLRAPPNPTIVVA